jgi:hypothetical protein
MGKGFSFLWVSGGIRRVRCGGGVTDPQGSSPASNYPHVIGKRPHLQTLQTLSGMELETKETDKTTSVQ